MRDNILHIGLRIAIRHPVFPAENVSLKHERHQVEVAVDDVDHLGEAFDAEEATKCEVLLCVGAVDMVVGCVVSFMHLFKVSFHFFARGTLMHC